MLHSVYKNTPKLIHYSPINIKNKINLTQTINVPNLSVVAYNFGSKKKRVIELNPSRVDFASVVKQPQ